LITQFPPDCRNAIAVTERSPRYKTLIETDKVDNQRSAEQQIEEARRTETTILDLSYLGLRELPEAIGSLTQLQWLDLNNNELRELPEAIGWLPNLSIYR